MPDPVPQFRFRWVKTATALTMLVGLSAIGLALNSQAGTLQETVDTTERIIDGNVRVYSQVQRELLRLAVALESGEADVDVLSFHAALVAQRLQEGTLPYQVNTLGGRQLLAEATRLQQRWDTVGRARLEDLVADGNPDGLERARLLGEMADIELAYNRLVSDSEIHRRTIAGDANASAAHLLDRSRQLLRGGILTLAAFVLFSGLVAAEYSRFDRHREATSVHLAGLNAELRTVSQVAALTHNMVVITDAEGAVTWVNDAFVSSTGYSAEEVIGRRPGDVLQGPDTDEGVVAEMSAALSRGEPFNCEVINYTRTGTPYWVGLEIQPVHDDAGELCNFIAVESDITAQRELEDRLRRAKEVAEETANTKARFLASMSHEIRTPLNAVIGLNSLLLDTALDHQQHEYAQTACASGRLLQEILDDVLNYSALESGGVELEQRPLSPESLVRETVALLGHEATAKGLDLAVVVEASTPDTVLGDSTRLRQVLINLLGNALKFTHAGAVTAAVRWDEGTGDDPALILAVTDTGIGIPEDRLDRLFRPFSQVDASTTRRFGGTGLGLAIVHDLVDLMAGDLTVDSVVGEGTTITARLPLDRPAVALTGEDAGADDEVPTIDPGLQVLLAEDDLVNQTVAVHMLARLGITPVVVDDGVKALEAVQSHSFDIVLMDLHMPEMDGRTAVAHLRTQLPDHLQPVVIGFTASAMAGESASLLDEGFDGHLAKPVGLVRLAEALRSNRSAPRRGRADAEPILRHRKQGAEGPGLQLGT